MFSITALGMAKAATMFVSASVFQGVATGHINISARGLAAAVATAGLIGSGPIAGADTTFTDMLGQQMVHAVQTAPIHTAINMAIGQEKFGDAITSSLRHGVGHAIGASLAHQMGQWYSGPDKINYFMHKMGHFASGAVGGAITADDPLGGAFGAAFAEVSMEAMADAEKVSQEIYQEDPNLSISEVKAIVKERLIAKRFFSQVIAGFAGTLAGGDFSVAANSAAIALDYNMEPTLTGAAVSAYLAQQVPALTAFLATPQGMAVAASLGVAALSIDQIKENLTLLGKLHQVYVMVLRGEVKINLMDVDIGKPKTLATPMHEGKSVVLGTPIADQQPVLPGYEVDTDAGRSAVEGFAEYDGPEMTILTKDGEVRLEIRHKPGSDRRDYERKLTALQDLAARGKLVKTDGVRNPAVTDRYRDGIIEQAEKQWGATDPSRVDRVEKALKRLQVDHMHELQLGGLDHASGLSLIDGSINASFGKQIQLQLAKVPVGTKITEVVEKVDE